MALRDTRLTISLDEEDKKTLKRIAEKEDRSMASVIRRAIKSYLAGLFVPLEEDAIVVLGGDKKE